MCKTTKYIHIYLYCYCSVSQSCSTLCNPMDCSTIYIYTYIHTVIDFSSGSDRKKSACNADLGLIPGQGRFPGERHGNTLQYSCLENSMDRKVWWATVRRVIQSQTLLKQPSRHTFIKEKEHKNPISLLQICPESSVHCSTLQIVPDHCLWAYVIIFS